MIYRFHIFEQTNDDLVRTSYSSFALKDNLRRLPEQLNWILQEAEVLNEILDLDKQEAYLKVTTELAAEDVVNAVNNKLKLSGLGGTLIS